MKWINGITGTQVKGLIFILLIVVVLGLSKIFVRNKIAANGVYLKSTILEKDGYKGGVLTTLKYTYKGHEYRNNVHSERPGEKVGEQYFIKILKDDPNELIFLEDNPVPQCLLDSNPPFEGWLQLPTCN
jgi:hypothetical protein